MLVCFRPLYGVSLFLRISRKTFKYLSNCFRPLYGVSLFLQELKVVYSRKICFRPLYGVSLFLLHGLYSRHEQVPVFVPSTGYLYFYKVDFSHRQINTLFSSPLRGISISTFKFNSKIVVDNRFRPLYGVSLFLLDMT